MLAARRDNGVSAQGMMSQNYDVTSIMKTADVSKLFFAIFERIHDSLYICHSIKSKDRGCNLHSPT